METDGGEMARLRQIGGRPGLVPASSRRGEIPQSRITIGRPPPVEPIAPESKLNASEFRPPAPTRRAPRRIAKRRMNKAARGNSGGLFMRSCVMPAIVAHPLGV